MAFISKVGNILKQTLSKHINSELSASNPSIFQAIRSMSSSKLFIGGLSYGTDDTSLREAFTSYGEVIDARVIMDRETGRSRGFGFVSFTSSEEATSAIQAMDGKDLHGRSVRVNYATDRAAGGGGGYGGGGYGGGGYGGGGGGGYGGGGGGSYGGGGNSYGSGGGSYGGSGGGGSYGGGGDVGGYGGNSGGASFGSGGSYDGGSSSGYGIAGGVGGDGSYANSGSSTGAGAFNQDGSIEGSYKDADDIPDDYASKRG